MDERGDNIVNNAKNLVYRGIFKGNQYALHLAVSLRCNIFYSDETISHACGNPPTNMEIRVPSHRLY